MRSSIPFTFMVVVGLAATNSPTAAIAQMGPLHRQIDDAIASSHVGPLSPLASDADFLRRVHLDLVGVVPSASQSRTFLSDQSADKRVKLIEQLLASPRHAQHLAQVLDVMLMERRADKYVPAAEWQKYLYDSMIANKPFDVLAREILSSDGTDPATRPAAKFFLDREAEPNLLTRDVGRIFFGRDLQCAQCHDHPLVDDYYQADYYALYAFFSRTQLFTFPDGDKKTVLMDNATGEVSFQSVFDPTAKGNTLPRVPGGKQIDEPRLPAAELWTVAPANNTRHIPKYVRRLELAGPATANRQFARNFVNRMWALTMGRGLVEPVDLHHSDNPPTHPELLELLADEFIAAKYDIKWLLRELTLSGTYQRSLDLPQDLATQSEVANAAALEAEHANRQKPAAQSRDAWKQVLSELTAVRKAIPPLIDERTTASAPLADLQKAIDAANKMLADAQGALAAKQDVVKALAAAATTAKEASAKLPEEKDLSQAAAVFQARSDQLQAEVAALGKAADEKSAAAKTEADKLAPIQQAIDEINGRLTAARQQVIALEERHDAALAQSQADRFRARLAERRLEEARAQGAYAAAAKSATAARATADKLAADLAAATAASAKLTTDLPGLQAAQTAAQKSNAEAQSALLASKQVVATLEQTAKEIGIVLAGAEAAAAKLPDDAEIKDVAAKLKARVDQLATDTLAAQQTVATQDAAAQAATAQLATADMLVAAATTQLTALQQSIPNLQSQTAAANENAAAAAQAERLLAEPIADRWSREFATRTLKQLSPEQFGWSVLRTTGVYENYIAATAAEIEQATPLSDLARADPVQLAARQRQIEEAVHAKLVPNIATFVQLFGAGAGQPQSDFFATVDQALFLANGSVVKSWLAPSGENLTARLLKLDDPALLADELYLSVLTRPASDVEKAEVARYLAARPAEKPLVVQELAWSLLSSAEFRFNH